MILTSQEFNNIGTIWYIKTVLVLLKQPYNNSDDRMHQVCYKL